MSDDRMVLPSPANLPTDLDAYALHGSFAVGSLTIHHVTDGLGFGNRRFWFNGIDPAAWMPPLGLTDPDTPFPVNFGFFVVVGRGNVTLVDAGFGPAVNNIEGMRAGNELLIRLQEIGVSPEQVDNILLTHMHSDHCGQLITDAADGDRLITFPHATVHVQAEELAYWTRTESDSDPMANYVRSRILPILDAGLVATFTSAVEVAPCVTAIEMAGHTEGHTVVEVSDGGTTCYLVGDLAHHPVHFCHHDWLPAIDRDPARSIRARKALTDRAIDQGAIVTAPHMPILTLGRLSRAADGGVVWERVEPGA